MPFDVKKLLDSWNLNASERQAAEAMFAEGSPALEDLKRGYSARDEASRLMDEGTIAKTEAQKLAAQGATDKAEAERIRQEAVAETEKNRTWAQALKNYEGDAQQAQIEREEFAAKSTAYENYLKEIGVADPTAILAGRMPAPRTPPPPPPAAKVPGNEPPPSNMDTKFIERYEAFEKQAGNAVGLLARLPFEIESLQLTHESLYGKRIAADKIGDLQNKYLDPQNARTLMDIAKEELHFADREKELQEQAITQRAEQMAKDMFQQRMDGLHLPSAVLDRAEAAPIVQFHSKEFTENVKRAGDLAQGNVDQSQLDAFMQVNEELAQQGIRPSTV